VDVLGNIRDSILELSHISKEERGMEVPLNICLFKRNDFGAEQMFEVQVLVEMFP
jgi:hypothetical protein